MGVDFSPRGRGHGITHYTHTHKKKHIDNGSGRGRKVGGTSVFFSFVLTSSRTLAAGLATYMYVSVVSVLTTEIPFFSLEMGKFTKYLHDTNETAIYVFVFFFDIFPLSGRAEVPENEAGFCGH